MDDVGFQNFLSARNCYQAGVCDISVWQSLCKECDDLYSCFLYVLVSECCFI